MLGIKRVLGQIISGGVRNKAGRFGDYGYGIGRCGRGTVLSHFG